MKKRLIKRFLKKRNSLIICLCILLSFIFISNGYSILNVALNITGASSIINNPEEVWKPDVEFVNTKQIDNIFFYDIIIHNNSKNTYQNWEINIYDNENITYAYEYGEKEDGYRIIKNTEWDNRIEACGSVTISIIFIVNQNVEDKMTVKEYAKYFVENYIKVSGSIAELNRNGKIITKGEASLTLKESEIEITNLSIKLDPLYKTEIENERLYILDITNDTEYDFTKIRANVYIGKENELLEVSPNEITCKNETNTNFELPLWIQLKKGQTTRIYLMIISKDENFIPDIVMSAKIE